VKQSKQSNRVLWRRLGAVLVIAMPLFFFLPGIGFDATHPASLARQRSLSDTWLYRVQPGDALTKIAETQLGTLHRYEEILALNPTVKPRALTVGSVLRMPARDPQAGSQVQQTPPVVAAAGNSPRRLLLAFAALLALVVVVVAVASRMERRAHEA